MEHRLYGPIKCLCELQCGLNGSDLLAIRECKPHLGVRTHGYYGSTKSASISVSMGVVDVHIMGELSAHRNNM